VRVGQDVLGCLGKPSFRITAEQILAAQPEVVFAIPCSYHADQAAAEYSRMQFPDGWNGLPAVRDARVFAMDALLCGWRRRLVQISFRGRTAYPMRIPGTIDRDKHNRPF
jgi:ABC-type Fe3+-hydroxamate transport system substrate-binding protein